jgi:tetratricopeptide (TPR) repeat protein
MHKKECKLRSAELRDEALFKDPPPKEDCSICFLPMPLKMISCISLPPATISSVPIADFAIANEELAAEDMEKYYSCCGKIMCKGCMYSFCKSGNIGKCPFCNSDQNSKTRDEQVEELMKRVAVNDADAICMLANQYHHGRTGFQQDHAKAMELYNRAAELKSSSALHRLGGIYYKGGEYKKAKFYYEAAAMAGHEVARSNLGSLEADYGNIERAAKHWTIAASAGCYHAMYKLRTLFEKGYVSRELIDSSLMAYNDSCAEMRSGARNDCIHTRLQTILLSTNNT